MCGAVCCILSAVRTRKTINDPPANKICEGAHLQLRAVACCCVLHPLQFAREKNQRHCPGAHLRAIVRVGDGFAVAQLRLLVQFKKKMFTLLDLCVSSLRRGHANLLCIVPILTDDPRRESNRHCADKDQLFFFSDVVWLQRLRP